MTYVLFTTTDHLIINMNNKTDIPYQNYGKKHDTVTSSKVNSD